MTRAAQNELFARWMEAHSPLLSKLARVYAPAGEHKDLLQDLLIAVWKSIPLYRAQAKPSTFIYRVALNRILNSARDARHYNRAHEPIDPLSEPAAPDSVDEEDRVRLLHEVIRTLPEVDRSLALMYLDEMSYADIADVMGITATNVGVRLNRIRTRLAEAVKEAMK